MDAEIRAILTRCPGYSADYVEDQPVAFRIGLIKKFIEDEKKRKDGSAAAAKA